MKRVIDMLRITYYAVGIIGVLVCIPFYIGLYCIDKKR